jgi:hypothetical protein
MPLTSFELAPQQAFDVKERLEFWVYRISAYLLINVIDDPAWLALIFC